MKRALATSLVGLGLIASASPARADLVYQGIIDLTGQGIGAVPTLITVQEPPAENGTNAGDGTESGCVAYTSGGTTYDCLNGLLGGDNQTAANTTYQLSTLTGLTSAGELAFVVNLNETGQDVSIVLTDLYMSLYSANPLPVTLVGNYQYTGPDLLLTNTSSTGVGTSGFLFVLDAAQSAAATLACPVLADCWVGGGVQFLAGSESAGFETVRLFNGPSSSVPAPGSLMLLGLGTLALLGATARRSTR